MGEVRHGWSDGTHGPQKAAWHRASRTVEEEDQRVLDVEPHRGYVVLAWQQQV